MISKKCIFCGLSLVKKTKEHIIPKWLIEHTGDLSRIINLGLDYNKAKYRQKGIISFSFNNFTFPACDKCNNYFSKLESKVKLIFMKIFDNKYINPEEISILLDWFDKVRIGLWLGMMMLKNTLIDVTPNFYIQDRIGKKDRLLYVYEVKDRKKHIMFSGVNMPVFGVVPSCFAIFINNFCFFNSSFDFLFAKNIGFPFPKKIFLNKEKMLEARLYDGTGKTKVPLINYPFLKPSIGIYQPIIPVSFKSFDEKKEKNIYDSNYIKNNSLDFAKGKGSIFLFENNKLEKLENEEIVFSNGNLFKSEFLRNKISEQVIDFQLFLYEKQPLLDKLTEEDKQNFSNQFKIIKKIQKAFLNLQKKNK